MSKEAAAAILVQTLFTADKSMQNLVMSHAKVGTAKPEEVVKFILPFYKEMLKAMDSKEGESENKEGESGAGDSGTEHGNREADGENTRGEEQSRDEKRVESKMIV